MKTFPLDLSSPPQSSKLKKTTLISVNDASCFIILKTRRDFPNLVTYGRSDTMIIVTSCICLPSGQFPLLIHLVGIQDIGICQPLYTLTTPPNHLIHIPKAKPKATFIVSFILDFPHILNSNIIEGDPPPPPTTT